MNLLWQNARFFGPLVTRSYYANGRLGYQCCWPVEISNAYDDDGDTFLWFMQGRCRGKWGIDRQESQYNTLTFIEAMKGLSKERVTPLSAEY